MLRTLAAGFLFVALTNVSAVAAPFVSTVGVVSSANAPAPEFRNGTWRAYLERKDGNNNIVFNFEVKDSAGKKVLYIRNACYRLLVVDISRQGDSVIIRLPFYESQ